MAEFSEAIIKIIDKKIKTIDTANLDLYDQLNDVEKLIFEDLKKAINKLNVEGGKIQFDDKNIDLVNSLDKVMIESIQRSTMPSAITKYLRNFQTISDFNYDVHKDVNDLSKAELEKLVSPVQKLAVETTLDGLTGSGVNTNFVEPVRQGIFKNIVAGTNRTQLEEYLSNYVLGNPNVDGLYSRYIKQISRDALGQFDGQTNAKIANEYGLDAFRYVGSLIDDSRPQCVRWVGKRVLQTSELQSEINWANNNGTGMISGTTIDNFAVFRGGYNCRHAAIPFKLTKSQREKLELEQSKAETKVETKIEQQIVEVQKDVKNQIQIRRDLGKDKINDKLFLSTQSDQLNNSMRDVIGFADGGVELINKRGTLISLRNETQSTQIGGRALMKKSNIDNPFTSIGKIDEKSNGNCAINNQFMNIKIKFGEIIEFKKVDMKLDNSVIDDLVSKGLRKSETRRGENCIVGPNNNIIATELKDGWKFWSVSSISRNSGNGINIAPTITHETGHIIQNIKDPQFSIVQKVMRDLNLKLNNSATEYGQSNVKEFWTESLTYYVYDNKNLKKQHPKIFEFVEKYVDEMGIDLKTIKLAK
jgi:hypothetical protein